MEKVNKIAKICLRVAGWLLLVLSIWALVSTVYYAFEAITTAIKQGTNGDGQAAATNLAKAIGFLLGGVIGFIIMLICSLKAIKVKKGAFAWAIVLLVFIVLNAVAGNGLGEWYQVAVRILYIVAAFVVRFTGPKKVAKAEE